MGLRLQIRFAVWRNNRLPFLDSTADDLDLAVAMLLA
jgi:hypothetical protein